MKFLIQDRHLSRYIYDCEYIVEFSYKGDAKKYDAKMGYIDSKLQLKWNGTNLYITHVMKDEICDSNCLNLINGKFLFTWNKLTYIYHIIDLIKLNNFDIMINIHLFEFEYIDDYIMYNILHIICKKYAIMNKKQKKAIIQLIDMINIVNISPNGTIDCEWFPLPIIDSIIYSYTINKNIDYHEAIPIFNIYF
jgi:hypothetical protein